MVLNRTRQTPVQIASRDGPMQPGRPADGIGDFACQKLSAAGSSGFPAAFHLIIPVKSK